MKYRQFGKANFEISEISLGTWQLGGKWGEEFSLEEALKTLKAAYDNGINFIDTADCYRAGLSEKAIGKFLKTCNKKVFVTTKIGRSDKDGHSKYSYTDEKIDKFIESSLKNLDVDALDMVLLHCPPEEVYYNEEVFNHLDYLKKIGKIKNYGVSVETVDQAIKALDYDISAIEIIFNMFRLKPSFELFKRAKEKNVGIIVRVPLASGLLTGKYDVSTKFGKKDHRTTNRNGERFSKGETFSGVDFELGLKAVDELKTKLKGELNLLALRYILMYDEVSTIIPGASSHNQIKENIKAIDLNPFTNDEMNFVKEIYNKYFKDEMELLW